MCGICGIKGLVPEERDKHIKSMLGVLYHRGPDEEGRYSDDNLSLGIRRLSIIDLKTGSQPIYNEDKSLILACNGEIYNFQVLRDSLSKKGHHFYTNSDLEVLVHLYEEYGLDCLKFTKGMFSFALWDKNRKLLFIARDRFGIKPLYYYYKNGIFAFASELKALLKLPFINRVMNNQALNLYFSLEYVPSPYSIFNDVYKLKPAHYMCFKNNNLEIKRYWNFKRGPSNNRLSFSEAKDEFKDILHNSIKEHLISDVPLGIFLSGGIDSSSLVASTAKIYNKDFSTFSIGFKEKTFDESKYARLVADYFGAEHYNFTFGIDDFINIFHEVTGFLDEPFADLSVFPAYLLSKNSRQYIKVALSGEGADEMLMGYPTYIAHKYMPFFNKLPSNFKKISRQIVNLLPVSFEYFSFDFKLKQLVQGINENNPIFRHALWMTSFSDEEKNLLFSEEFKKNEFKEGTAVYDFVKSLITDSGNKKEIYRLIQYLDVFTYLSEGILVKSDRSSMNSSLEVRVPYLDHKLAEFLWSIDSRLIYQKRILKSLMEENIPKGIVSRPKKGFAIPFANWFRDKRFLKIIEEFFSKSFIEAQGLFNYAYVNQVFNAHLSGKEDNRKKLRTYLMFQCWYKNWFR